MGNASSILSSVVSKLVRGRDSALDYGYAHYLRNHSHGDTHNHDLVAGTAPIDLVLLGNRAQTLMPKIDALRSDPYPQAGTGATDSVRIVRRSPTADGMQETTVYSSALTCTILDVSLVQGELDAYRACLLHAMAFVFVVDLARYDESDEEPTSLRSVMRDFERLCSGTWCTQGVPIILLFDNEDVFSKKFAFDSGAFGARFTDYMGEEDDAFAASQFILQRFMGMKTDRYGAVYVHFTFREDRRMARVLFAAVQDIVLQRVLEESAQQPKAWKSCSSLLSLSRIGSHMRHLGERWAG